MSEARKGRKLTPEHRYKLSLARRKRVISEVAKEKIRLSKLKERNPMWKGDNVGYYSLHEWVKNHLPKPQLCEACNNVPPYDLANISGKYKRDLTDWQWLCRSCHMKSDGRMEKIHSCHIIDMSGRKCFICGSSKTRRRKQRSNRELWYKFDNEFICSNCYTRGQRHNKKKS